MPQHQARTLNPNPKNLTGHKREFFPRTAVNSGPSPQSIQTEPPNHAVQQSSPRPQNLSQIPNTAAQRQPDAHQNHIQIASPKPSDHGYQKIAAVAGGNQSIGSVQIKGSPVQGKMEVASLEVNPDHRQQGISKSLLSAAAQAGKQQGYHKATLGVDPEAPDMSTTTLKSIYARQGYKSTGQDSLGRPLMEKDL